MSDINLQTDLKPDQRNKPLYGFYRGVVIDNKDRSLDNEGKNYGRVLVHIPKLMDDETIGVWAMPANNPIGGRNTGSRTNKKNNNNGKHEFCGSSYIPPSNSWVWIFFEGGDPNHPFYSCGVDIKAHELPPEMCVDKTSKPEERWLIFRSPHGRVIMISDDPENCRIEITGSKRTKHENSNAHVYEIDNNQKTILIDERKGKEKILLKDECGNFINIRTHKNDIDIFAKRTIRIFSGQDIYFDAPHIGFKYNSCQIQGSTLDQNLSSHFYTTSPSIHTNTNPADTSKVSPTDDTTPNGKRDG